MPHQLAIAGMLLEDWQQAFDTAYDHWNDRCVALGKKETAFGWIICFRVRKMGANHTLLALLHCETAKLAARLRTFLDWIRLEWLDLQQHDVLILPYYRTFSLVQVSRCHRSAEQNVLSPIRDPKHQVPNVWHVFRRHIYRKFVDSFCLGFCLRVQTANEEEVAGINANSHASTDWDSYSLQNDELRIANEHSFGSSVREKVVAAESDSTLSEGANDAEKRIDEGVWNEDADPAILEELARAAFLASCERMQTANEEEVVGINASSHASTDWDSYSLQNDELRIAKEHSFGSSVREKVVAAESDSTLSEGGNDAEKRSDEGVWNEDADPAILEELARAAFLASYERSCPLHHEA